MERMRFTVSIARGARIFIEIAEALASALAELGHDVRTGVLLPDRRNIVLAVNDLSIDEFATLPPGSILYNMEQLAGMEGGLAYVERCRTVRDVEWWDYSIGNMHYLARHGVPLAARWVPLGFAEPLNRIRNAPEPDIDVLFVGLITPRRRPVLELLQRHCRCMIVQGKFGEERDALIARSKIVLNIHSMNSHILEIVRVLYLVANGKAVVSERNPTTEVAPWLERAIATAPYERLALECLKLLADEPRRRALADAALGHARAAPMTEVLAAVLRRGPPGPEAARISDKHRPLPPVRPRSAGAMRPAAATPPQGRASAPVPAPGPDRLRHRS